ncbi:MAG: hypothetical protein O2794_04000 [bacterium]|nr:hypothetical protein [bacterium]
MSEVRKKDLKASLIALGIMVLFFFSIRFALKTGNEGLTYLTGFLTVIALGTTITFLLRFLRSYKSFKIIYALIVVVAIIYFILTLVLSLTKNTL